MITSRDLDSHRSSSEKHVTAARTKMVRIIFKCKALFVPNVQNSLSLRRRSERRALLPSLLLVGKVIARWRFIEGVGLLAIAFAAESLTLETLPFPNAVSG